MLIADALKRLTEDIKRKGLINSGDKLILGCSGGADSNALLYLFSRLRYVLNVSLLAVHVNHQLRGEESLADEQTVKQLCLKLSVPLIIRKIDIPKTGNLEGNARKLRFEAFNKVMQSYSFTKILLAHHRDDQTETVLLNLFRGSGISGMAGIKPLSGKIVHPLLCFSRMELEAVLVEAGITWRIDSSNADNSYSRNKLRNDLIPHIKAEYSSALSEHLGHQAEILYQADRLIRDRAKQQTKRIALEYHPGKVVLEIKPLAKLSEVEQYYIIRQCFRYISNTETDFMTAHFMAILDVISSDGSKQLHLSQGVKVKKLYNELHFYVKEEISALPDEELEIDADRARAVFGDYRFTFKYLKVAPKDLYTDDGSIQVLLDADKIKFPFKIRYRRPGDKFMPFGMKSFKRLKEFFIDEKVPKYDRELVPIMDDGEKLFWIVGYRIDERVRYDDNTSRFLLLRAESTSIKPKRAANRIKTTRGNDESDEL
jgi:tRNA(Ile)-lysidine synthase